MPPVIEIRDVSKVYASGFRALDAVDLSIARGEIFALLGPNGAGKTTLIHIVCGIVRPSSGRIVADGHDIQTDYRLARQKIGLVPQELHTDAFETVWASVRFSRGLFGKPRDDAYLEKVLADLSLTEKRHEKIMNLSGGMKRRVMIAKALSHEPRILFLDEPTAGVDVALRREMWAMVRSLKRSGVTIILTTHYIEEAEELADRVGVIARGKIVVVEEKATLMRKLGGRTIELKLKERIESIPEALAREGATLGSDGASVVYTMPARGVGPTLTELLGRAAAAGVEIEDVETKQTSLEDIFLELVGKGS